MFLRDMCAAGWRHDDELGDGWQRGGGTFNGVERRRLFMVITVLVLEYQAAGQIAAFEMLSCTSHSFPCIVQAGTHKTRREDAAKACSSHQSVKLIPVLSLNFRGDAENLHQS
jgi:hypothetical protein